MDEDNRMEDESFDDVDNDGTERLTEDEILKVIPLEEFLASGGRAAFSDGEDDDIDGQSTSGELPDDSVGTLECHQKDVFAVATSGSRWMATGGEDDRALIFDLDKSESEPVLEIAHTDSVTFVCFNKAETLLASGDMSGKIYITELATLQRRIELDDCSDLEWLLWHHSSDILFAGDKEGLVWMWLIGNKGVAQSKIYSAGSGARCTSGVLLPDGKRLLAGYEDGHLRMWALKDQTHVAWKINNEVNTVEVHPSLPVAAAGTISGDVHMLSMGPVEEPSLKRHAIFRPLPPPPKEERMEGEDPEVDGGEYDAESIDRCVETIAFGGATTGASNFVAIGRNDGTIAVHAVDQVSPRFTHRNDSAQAITRIRWCSTGTSVPPRPLLVTSSVDSFVRAHDARDGSMVKELCCGGDSVLDMVVLQTDPVCRLLAACSEGSIRVLQIDEEEKQQ
ncbi:hypothetical protein PFISCL1PPCAC_11278 [Pristionchus fissidentatus]|uniref:WD40 domain-containing protein n=1 Tax=Pristionchus fissidentatus TaxID=1538716 RepID=A0AAV5VK27_9BILA|nr:hypothetical protein PFISCL1PPCAC_11278 [Pristionchus fissidentatus]